MRPSSLAGIILAVALAIVFFKVYGLITRPSVPTPVAFVVDNFAPGVEIGKHVSDARRSVAAMSYVPHLGFVGVPGLRNGNMPNGQTVSFAQVRLLLDEKARSQPNPDPARSRIDAVEMLTGDPTAAGALMMAFGGTFQRPPREGCIRMSDDRLREVHVWTTPNQRGGVALVTPYGDPDSRTAPPEVASVLAFLGQFDGGRTLRANYVDASCSQTAESTGANPAELALAAAASDSVTAALNDSLGLSPNPVVTQAGTSIESLNACDDIADARGWETSVSDIVEMELPPGFHTSAAIGQMANWNGPIGWIHAAPHTGDKHAGWTGLITSECDVYISGSPAHLDLVTTTYGHGVHALIQLTNAPWIGIEGEAKTVGGQAQLLHAIRYARVSAAWGR